MFRPFVHLLEVLCDDLLNLLAILEDFQLLPFHFPFNPRDNWVTSFDLEDLVRHLVELFQFALT